NLCQMKASIGIEGQILISNLDRPLRSDSRPSRTSQARLAPFTFFSISMPVMFVRGAGPRKVFGSAPKEDISGPSTEAFRCFGDTDPRRSTAGRPAWADNPPPAAVALGYGPPPP